ncbi:hypothetical protein Tco_1545337 [Tanacetum coccineum]
MKMDWYTKNALWLYWKIGDNEEVLTDEELYNPEGENLNEDTEIAEIFRIETDIFHFKTPLCEAFNKFNYLFKIDVDVLTSDIFGLNTYSEYKDAWIYEWNKDVLWLFRFKNRHAECLTCNWKKEKYCNRGDLPGEIRIGDMIYFEDYEWYEGLEYGELKDEALNVKAVFEGSKKIEEESSKESPIDEWEDFEHANHIETDVNPNYNPLMRVVKILISFTTP